MTPGVLAWTAWAALFVWAVICIVISAASQTAKSSAVTDFVVIAVWLLAGVGFIAVVYLTAQAALA